MGAYQYNIMTMISISFWPIIVAALVAFAIGALWYSPILFGKEWMSLTRMSESDVSAAREKGVAKLYIGQFIVSVVTFGVLGFFIAATGAMTAGDGAFIAFLAWLGFPLMSGIGDMFWQKKPFKLFLITAVGTLISWIIGGAIIGAWR